MVPWEAARGIQAGEVLDELDNGNCLGQAAAGLYLLPLSVFSRKQVMVLSSKIHVERLLSKLKIKMNWIKKLKKFK